MATGGRVGFETVAWFNGGLFDDSVALPGLFAGGGEILRLWKKSVR